MANRKRKSKTFNKMNYNNKAQSKQISKLTNVVNKLKKAPERKIILNNRGLFVPVAGVATQTALNDLVQGTTDDTRIGDVVTMKSLTFIYGNSALNPDSLYRLLLIVDLTNNNNIAPLPLALLFNQSATITEACYSTLNDNFVGRGKKIRVLHDTGPTRVSSISSPFTRKIHKRFKLGYKVHYSTNLGTSADIIDKCLSLYLLTVDVNHVYSWSSLVEFTDS